MPEKSSRKVVASTLAEIASVNEITRDACAFQSRIVSSCAFSPAWTLGRLNYEVIDQHVSGGNQFSRTVSLTIMVVEFPGCSGTKVPGLASPGPLLKTGHRSVSQRNTSAFSAQARQCA